MGYLKTARYWINAARHRRPGLDLDQVASQNYSLPLPVHQEVRNRQVRFVEDALRAIPGPKHVLDLGCGPGTFACQLAPLVDSWLGFDISPEFVEHANTAAQEQSLKHLDFRVSSMLEVNEGRRFNVAVLGGTLGYVQDEDLSYFMHRVHQHLVPGGVAYVRISVIPGIYPRIKLRGDYHIDYRKRSHYVRVFREAGFHVTWQRDYAFTDASLATIYTALARWYGRTGMTAYRVSQILKPLSFGLARTILDLTPVPQSMQFLLYAL